MKNAFNLYEVLGHEMIHVAHHNRLLDNFNHGSSEFAAYNWSFNVNKNLYGSPDRGIINLRRSYIKYAKNSYDYDKFGF